MKKILYALLISFLFVTTSLATDNKPRELTPKERMDVCKFVDKEVKRYYNSLKGTVVVYKKAEVKCEDKKCENMIVASIDMSEKKAKDFFGNRLKEELAIAGYKKIHFDDLNGTRYWTLNLGEN